MKPIVLSLGEIVWDMLPSGPVMGGAPLNFAYYAGKSGADAYIVSAVGNDEMGEMTLKIIEGCGVSIKLVQRNGNPTGRVGVSFAPNGEPQYDIETGSSWDAIECTEEAAALAAKADCICFGSLAQRSEPSRRSIQKLLSLARPGCLKVFDINLRQNWWSKEVIESSLQAADILKLNEDEIVVLAGLFGTSEDKLPSELIGKYALKYVILTKGGDSSSIYTAEGLASFLKTPECEVVDTVGAGDSFTATFVASILAGDNEKAAHLKAVEVAAEVCGHKGAIL